jgi:hypothetical protein
MTNDEMGAPGPFRPLNFLPFVIDSNFVIRNQNCPANEMAKPRLTL